MEAILIGLEAFAVNGIKKIRIKTKIRHRLPDGLGGEKQSVVQSIFIRATGSISGRYSNKGYIQVSPSPLSTLKISANWKGTEILSEPITRNGFWSKVWAGPGFNPQAYAGMSRIWNPGPTIGLGQKTF